MTADNEDHQRLLARIKRRLRMDTFSVDYIVKVCTQNPFASYVLIPLLWLFALLIILFSLFG